MTTLSAFLAFAPNTIKQVKITTLLKNAFSSKKEEIKSAQIAIANRSLIKGEMAPHQNETVTLIFNKENLDSLFGLSFFMSIYEEDKIKLIDYNNVTGSKESFSQTDRAIVLGVEISQSDLVHLSGMCKSVSIFGYSSTYDHLYYKNSLGNVTLYQPENNYFSGFGVIDNTIAQMLNICFSETYQWANWKQSKLALNVAHYATMYANISNIGLYKSSLNIEETVSGNDKNRKGVITNDVAVELHDLHTKMEASLQGLGDKIFDIVPEKNATAYTVYKDRLINHIEKTRTKRLFAWSKFVGYGNRVVEATVIPAVGFAVNDLLTIASGNTFTTVCVEDIGEKEIFHIFSRNFSSALFIASSLEGERMWIEGQVVRVCKMKDKR